MIKSGLFNDYSEEALDMPADDDPRKSVQEEEHRVVPLSVMGMAQRGKSPEKKSIHHKMRSLGMGKHVAGNAHSLANHQRIPGEIAVGQGKTVSQWKNERRAAKKKKNKMARQSRRKNRR